MVAMIHEALGDREAARAGYERVLEANGRAGVAANNLAWMYAEDGRFDDAVRLATEAGEVMRDRPEPLDTLGWAYYRKGLPVHAMSAFERAIERAPDNPLYHYHLGLAHLKAGNEAQGQSALRRALDLNANFAGAEEARKLLSGHGETGDQESAR